VKSTRPDSNIIDDFLLDAVPEPDAAGHLELTASFDDNHELTEDWLSADWF
jgi:hypothetical protein